jgi:hypothetical protein
MEGETEEKDSKRVEVMNKVTEFEAKLNGIIQDRSCSTTNPFIKNLADFVYYYIPEYENLFKYFLLSETIKAIIEVSNPDIINDIKQTQNIMLLIKSAFEKKKRLFNNVLSEDEKKPKILLYICEIFDNYSINTDQEVLTEFTNKTFGKNGTIPYEEPPTIESQGTSTPKGGEPEEVKVAEEICYINSKKEREIENQLLTDNITKQQISIDVDSIITDQVNRVSRYLISQSKKYSVKQEHKTIEKILNNYTYEYREDVGVSNTATNTSPFVTYMRDTLSDLFKKPNTAFKIITIQSIKTYLINIVRTIVSTLKQNPKPVYSLCLFLLVLLQDSTIKGYINHISSKKEYLFCIREYNKVEYKINNHDKQQSRTPSTYTEYPHYDELETPTLCLCMYIYSYLTRNSSIKPAPFINMESIANKMRHRTVKLYNSINLRFNDIRSSYSNNIESILTALSTNLFPKPPAIGQTGGIKIGLPKLPSVSKVPNVPGALSAPKKSMFKLPSFSKKKEVTPAVESGIDDIKAPVPSEFSKFSPNYEATKLKTGKYIENIKGLVQTKINGMNFSDNIKRRFAADANDLRMTLLYCFFELVDSHFADFLQVLFENDIADVQPIAEPEPNAIASEIAEKENIISAGLYKMFLRKMINDINNSENKINEEILIKYVSMVSEINVSDNSNTQNVIDISRTLQLMKKQKRGGSVRTIRHTRKRRLTSFEGNAKELQRTLFRKSREHATAKYATRKMQTSKMKSIKRQHRSKRKK